MESNFLANQLNAIPDKKKRWFLGDRIFKKEKDKKKEVLYQKLPSHYKPH